MYDKPPQPGVDKFPDCRVFIVFCCECPRPAGEWEADRKAVWEKNARKKKEVGKSCYEYQWDLGKRDRESLNGSQQEKRRVGKV